MAERAPMARAGVCRRLSPAGGGHGRDAAVTYVPTAECCSFVSGIRYEQHKPRGKFLGWEMWWQTLPGMVRQQYLPNEPRGRLYYQSAGHGHAVREPLNKIQKIIKEMNP